MTWVFTGYHIGMTNLEKAIQRRNKGLRVVKTGTLAAAAGAVAASGWVAFGLAQSQPVETADAVDTVPATDAAPVAAPTPPAAAPTAVKKASTAKKISEPP